MKSLRSQDVILSFVVFGVVLIALKLNQYFFFTFNTSPAVILLPTGIALAAVFLRGYYMAVPVGLAWFIASLTSPSQPAVIIALIAAIAYTVQSIVGTHFLKRYNFLGTLSQTRGALVLVAVALAVSAIAPVIMTGAQWLVGSLSVSLWASFSRAWAGGVMNVMIFTPLITVWVTHNARDTRKELVESSIALLALVFVVWIVFWTKLPQVNIFVTLYVFFAVLFWMALRLHPRMIATGLFLTTVLGMAGSIFAHPSTGSLNLQLFADELFMVFIAPIFFVLTSLVEERRISAQEAQARTEELEEANLKLSQEDSAKNEFLATLAHELRNPLAPVVSSLELMKIKAQEIRQPEFIELIDIADRHNATLVHLLDDLLDVSRISRKKFKLQKESVELRPIIEQAVRTVEALYKERSHTLLISTPEHTLWLEADPLRFEQILVNLLNNAARYTKPGGTIVLSIIHDPQKGLRISVKDNGVGIESHMLTKIFEPFVQSHEGSAGLGIGLALTKRLVELHGGEVWAESGGLGKGSDFVVVLPIAQSVQMAFPQTPRRRRRGFPLAAEAKVVQAHGVLIVDDNRAAAEGLQKLLEHGGHSVSVAYDGRAAIKAMSTEKAEVVLLDIGLPGMDGYAVAKELRREQGQTPPVLVALTGYGQESDKSKAREAGFDYHLTKPVSITDIESILTKI